MKRNWSSSLRDPARQPWILFALLAAVNGAFWAVVMTTFPRETPAAVLHYSVGVGIDFVGEGRQIVLLPAASSILLALNALLAFGLRQVSKSAVWIMLGGAVVVQLLLLAAYFYILLLN